MSDSTELQQTGGDNSRNYQARRDLYVNPTIINHEKRMEVMKRLIESYHEERDSSDNTEFKGYISKIERYTTNIDSLSNLKIKLTNAGFEDDVSWALKLKENYAKTLTQNSFKFSPASQRIHAFLLAKVLIYFNNKVLPEIKAQKPHSVIKSLIIEEVIEPVEEFVGGKENVLELYSDDINAMLYYLTGNCHIKWI